MFMGKWLCLTPRNGNLGYVASEDVVDLVENEAGEEWNDWGRSGYYDDDETTMDDEEHLSAIATGAASEGE
jgi:hypothetical protein